jgi:protein TonB
MAIVKTKKADLNIHYKKYFQISIILVLVLLIAAFKFSPENNKVVVKEKIPEWIPLDNIVATKQPPLPPALKKPELPQFTISDTPVDIEIDGLDFSNQPEDIITNKPDKSHIIVEEEEHNPFIPVESMPTIIGGLESIAKNIYYTEIAKRIGIEGKVVIYALINKNGDVEDVKVLKGLLPELDEIALKAIRAAKFNPGMQRNKPVKVWVSVPILFKLK